MPLSHPTVQPYYRSLRATAFVILNCFGGPPQDVPLTTTTMRTDRQPGDRATLSNVNSARREAIRDPCGWICRCPTALPSAVSISGVTHTPLVVATEHGTVYSSMPHRRAWEISTSKPARPPTAAGVLKSS